MVANENLVLRGRVFFWPETVIEPCLPLDICGEMEYALGMDKRIERQLDIASAIREVIPPPDNEVWGAFTDLIRAVAAIVDGAETLVNPKLQQDRFQAAWEACAKLWSAENNRILRDCLGGQEDFNRVAEHPNGQDAFGRILQRVRETHGDLSPGMVVEVEVNDILEELDIIG